MLICSGTEAEFLLSFKAACILWWRDKLYEAVSSLQLLLLNHLHGAAGSCRLTDNQKKTFFFPPRCIVLKLLEMKLFVNHFVLENNSCLFILLNCSVSLSSLSVTSLSLLLVTLRMAEWVWTSVDLFTVIHKHMFWR